MAVPPVSTAPTAPTAPTVGPATSTVVGAAVVDVLAVLVFAAIGRGAHAERVDPLGVLQVAAPFLAGLLAGWLAGRVWREPLRLRVAAAGWLGTVLLGPLLRLAVLHRLPLTFVLVAAASLTVFLLGWRVIVLAIARVRRRSA